MAENQDTDVKTTTDSKETQTRGAVVRPRPLSADPVDEDNKPDPGPKTDRAGEVVPRERG